MPALDDSDSLGTIGPPGGQGRSVGWPPSKPAGAAWRSPSIDGLSGEVLSAKERGWWGHRFGIDTPYWERPAGWGEWLPVVDS